MNPSAVFLLAAFFLFNPLLAIASNYPRVDGDIKSYDETVSAKEKQFTQIPADPQDTGWVKKKLAHMVEVDQYMRLFSMNTPFDHAYSPEEKTEFWKQFGPRFAAVDDHNTRDLKALLTIYEWFTISRFGNQADNNAWLLVQHADRDWAFQKQVLAILNRLYPRGETNPINDAYLSDRVAASWSDPSRRRPQLYGTQGTCIGPAHWEPLPIAAPVSELNLRRKKMGLDSEEAYLGRVSKFCH